MKTWQDIDERVPNVDNAAAADVNKLMDNCTILKIGYITKVVDEADYVIPTSANERIVLVKTGAIDRTIQLPKASSNQYRVCIVLKTDAGAGKAIVDGFAAETINGSATFEEIATQFSSATFFCDGVGWYVLEKNIV
jgi:hypothetical protein